MKDIEITLADGNHLFVEVTPGDDEQEVAYRDLQAKLREVTPVVRSLVKELAEALSEVRITSCSISMGFGFKLSTSGISLLLTKGEANANLKATVNWNPSVVAAVEPGPGQE